LISDSDIGIVVQGEVRPTTLAALRCARRLYPASQLLLSTYGTQRFEQERKELEALADLVLVNEDPGPLPPTVISPTAPANNVNRQIVSTAAGLSQLGSIFALKMRSDITFERRGIDAVWRQIYDETGIAERLAALSIYTRHPRGINGYLFHLSDWITFGRTSEVRRYWTVPLMETNDATWYERHRHGRLESPIARRFRARYTPEQWVCAPYAADAGFAVPNHLAERSRHLVHEYERFLAQRCVIIDCATIGADLPEHRHAFRSWFQRIDCVNHSDWRALHYADRDRAHAPTKISRRIARWGRFAIGAEILFEKWLKRRLASVTRGR
jgi:hypothetical protein